VPAEPLRRTRPEKPRLAQIKTNLTIYLAKQMTASTRKTFCAHGAMKAALIALPVGGTITAKSSAERRNYCTSAARCGIRLKSVMLGRKRKAHAKKGHALTQRENSILHSNTRYLLTRVA
jgi:hypothetical protein